MAAKCEIGVSQFFAGKHVFITGATGFMGKVLVERLLSTCADVGRIYLLMRSKKDHSPEQRLQELKASQAFDNLRQSQPSQLEKLRIVAGDIMLPGLGISQEGLEDLQEVSVVFHSAATVKFNEALKIAIEQNLMSVIRLLEICDRLPHMQAFVHVSTAYSNPELSTVEERVYPPPVPLDYLLDLAAEDSPLLDNVESFISPKPNSYTFTKAMAEAAVQRHGCQYYPIAIVRPTIVISSLKHPFPGWLENANGPTGVIFGAGRGLLRVFRCRQSALADLLPVDIGIDTLIAAAWEVASDRPPSPRVYNCSISENPTTWGDLKRAINLHTRSQPQCGAVWYPGLHTAENGLNLIRVSTQMKNMQNAMKYFALREWRFQSDNVRRLRERMSDVDKRIYNLDPCSIVWDEHYSNYVKGVRLYLLREKELDQPAAKKRLKKLYYLHYGLSVFMPFLLFRAFVRRKHRQNILEVLFAILSIFNAIFRRSTQNILYIYKVSLTFLNDNVFLNKVFNESS
ncbi:putative fatty acyl-CoA reductase CG5065 isoform X2 [Amyelois transitella]|uniref:putative fatty acyl-CoA reductase CG5065 isoform X2 n=1 Tax=Amyelois transitella TaxID=680683 RepID=UPI00067B376C|nr:putative fatty acyl-CoA reductase CG5065 isoform X2 [Amyelois transitella]